MQALLGYHILRVELFYPHPVCLAKHGLFIPLSKIPIETEVVSINPN